MRLELKKINEAINAISYSIDTEQYEEALLGSEIMLNELEKYEKSESVLRLFFNLAGQFIDAGTSLRNKSAVSKGIQILETYSEHYENLVHSPILQLIRFDDCTCKYSNSGTESKKELSEHSCKICCQLSCQRYL